MKRAVDALTKLPGLGPRGAQRIIFYLLRREPSETNDLLHALNELRAKIRFCSACGNLTSDSPCHICRDVHRDHKLICVVEDPKDVIALEQADNFRGTYHVLMGKISPLEGVGPEHLRIKELLARVDKSRPREVIIATGSDTDGETTALYLARVLKPLKIRVTRIAAGIPVGSALDFIDPVTLTRALEGRKDF